MIGPLVTAVVSGEATAILARARRAAVAYALVSVFFLFAVGFLLLAGYVALATEIGALYAALCFAGGFLLLALIVFATYRIVERTRAKRAAERRKSEVAAVASAAAFAVLPTLLAAAGRGRGLAFLIPAAAGLAFGVWRENTRRRRPPPAPPRG